MKKALRKLVVGPIAALLVGSSSVAQADIWSWSFTDMGVDYSLTFESLSGNLGTFTLVLDTTGYQQNGVDPATAFLDSVDLKAWDGNNVSFQLVGAPGGTSAWYPSGGPISSGPVSNTGCKGTSEGFACVEAATKDVFDVLSGSSYSFTFAVMADSFLSSPNGTHIGAGYADQYGRGAGYGITSVSVSMVPEPETYAMLLVGLGLIAVMARRRVRLVPQLAA